MANYGTSPLRYLRRIDGGSATNKRPLDALAAHATLNNALHLADESSQVLVAWSASLVGTGGAAPPVGYLTTNSGVAAGTPSEIVSWPIQLRLRETGLSYAVRIRIAGANDGGTSNVYFYAVLTSRDSARAYADIFSTGVTTFPNADHVFKTAATSSGTAAWLTGASNGANAWTTSIRLDALRAADWTATQNTYTDVGGTSRVVRVLPLNLSVFAVTDSAAHPARLYAVYAAEYVGA